MEITNQDEASIPNSLVDMGLGYAYKSLNLISKSSECMHNALGSNNSDSCKQFIPIRDKLYIIKDELENLIKEFENNYTDKDRLTNVKE